MWPTITTLSVSKLLKMFLYYSFILLDLFYIISKIQSLDSSVSDLYLWIQCCLCLQATGLNPGGLAPLAQALEDKPARQSFFYTGPSTDLDNIQPRAAGVPAPGLRPPDAAQPRRTSAGENGGVPRSQPADGGGPKMVRSIKVEIMALEG